MAKSDSKLVGTPDHPFWSVTRRAWVEMGRLRPGERLLLADGSEAVVATLQREYAPVIFENWTPGQAATGTLGTPADPTTGTFTTYNFEVADWHTYFAAGIGAAAWVHNTGKLCPEATEAVRKWKDQGFNKQEREALWEQRKQGRNLEAGSFSPVLPNDTNVVRGGINTPESLAKGTGTHPSGVHGVSVESSPGKSVLELAANLPGDYRKMGVTTVGDVRRAGGFVVPTSGRSPTHATMGGLTPQQMSDLFKIILNPAKS